MSDLSLERRPPRRREFRYDPNEVRGEEVYRDARRHTGLVRWLKIILPALAGAMIVAFLVTMKMVTGNIGELFSLAGITMDTKSLIMEKPHLSGFKGTEHSYEVVADRAVQDLANPKVVRLENIAAEFGLTSDVRISLDATTGVFDGDKEMLELTDGITVSSTDGYAAKLDQAHIDFRGRTLASQGPVEIRSNEGLVRARELSVTDRGKKIVFSGGVSVTYMPPATPETPEANPPAPESE
jgi:lipopolysaccharide export system protein LptC